MSLQEYLYSEHTISDVLNRYIEELTLKGEIQDRLHANKLIAYQNLIQDKQFLKDIRSLFNETYDLISRNHPNVQFSIAGRRKALVSSEKKICQYSELGKSLDLIRDFLGFRIILFGDNSLDLVQHCYSILEDIIEFAATRGFTPCESLPLIGANPEPQNQYFESFKYKDFVKDYFCYPKKNGYRSLHLVLVDTKGRHLEIQIRTLAVHAEVEAGEANHRDYKKATYGVQDLHLERDKIAINGYAFVDGHIFDYAGVEFPITVFQRQKTF